MNPAGGSRDHREALVTPSLQRWCRSGWTAPGCWVCRRGTRPAAPRRLRLGARLGWGRVGLAGSADPRSAPGCPVRDQARDRQVGLAEVLPAAEIALQRPPLLVLGD